MRFFCCGFMGSISAWLPSRRSTLAQIGALVMERLAHWRLATWGASVGRYLRWSKVVVMFGSCCCCSSITEDWLPGAIGPPFLVRQTGEPRRALHPAGNGRKECMPMAEADDCVYGWFKTKLAIKLRK